MPEVADEVESEVVAQVARHFYAVVPDQLQTYCLASARIAVHALLELGIDAKLVPCQLWYAAPGKNVVVGFAAEREVAGKWDGHVICVTRRFFIDPTVQHLQNDFGIKAPRLACARRFLMPAQAIARMDLSPSERLWWYQPPPGADTTLPDEPADVIERFGTELATLVRQQMSQPA